jgi:phycobilisome core-membrane linker protein
LHHAPETVILGAYRQVFGRELFADQRITVAETKLKGGEVTVRRFVGLLAKSPVFRNLYWDKLYVTKAIEYIHRRLLGRPTYGRKELERYYDLCARQGFYALVDGIVNSAEYGEVFGEDTVPYERYITPRGFDLRSRHRPHGSGSPVSDERVADGEWVHEALQRCKPKGQGGQNGRSSHPEFYRLETHPNGAEALEMPTPENIPEPEPEESNEPETVTVGFS